MRWQRTWLIVAAFIGIVAVRPAECQTPTARQIIQQGKAATALVVAGEGNGSAFCIDAAGYFVTNYHVVEEVMNAAPPVARPARPARPPRRGGKPNEAKPPLTLILNAGEATQKTVPATVVRADAELDLALLKAELPLAVPALPLGATDEVFETLSVAVFGFPFGTDLSFNADEIPAVTVTTGRITALRKKKGELDSLQLDAAVNPGNSGGPVLNDAGRVIGVVVAGIMGADGVNFAIPATLLMKFLGKPEIAVTPAALSRDQMHGEVDFGVLLTSFGKSFANCIVDLELRSGNQPARRQTAVLEDDNRYHTTAVPLAPGEGGRVYRIVASGPSGSLVAHAKDQALLVGDRTVQLSRVRSITRRDKLKVVLNDGPELNGPIVGLNGVEVTFGAGFTALNLTPFTNITVEDDEAANMFVYAKVVVKQGAETVAIKHAVIRPTDATPPPPQPGARPPVFNADNGHWYQEVFGSPRGVNMPAISWGDAKIAVENGTYGGYPGHLATITSAAEQRFIETNLPVACIGQFWIGSQQTKGFREPDGGWGWLTGERWDYTKWNEGEPNNAGGTEDAIQLNPTGWNDVTSGNNGAGYLVEYEPSEP